MNAVQTSSRTDLLKNHIKHTRSIFELADLLTKLQNRETNMFLRLIIIQPNHKKKITIIFLRLMIYSSYKDTLVLADLLTK